MHLTELSAPARMMHYLTMSHAESHAESVPYLVSKGVNSGPLLSTFNSASYQRKGTISRLGVTRRESAYLCEPERRAALYPKTGALAKEAGVPAGSRVMFELDDWQHPRLEDMPSDSVDIVAMVNALETKTPLLRLPGKPNTHVRHWLNAVLEKEPKGARLEWGQAS
jgi:hypothetical protein